MVPCRKGSCQWSTGSAIRYVEHQNVVSPLKIDVPVHRARDTTTVVTYLETREGTDWYTFSDYPGRLSAQPDGAQDADCSGEPNDSLE